MEINYRPIIKSDDIERVVDLHGLIWFTDDRDAIPSHVLFALQHVGSLLLGAFDGEKPVGLSLAFPGERYGQRMLWSHVTGVLPEYQGRGIGRQLKWLQYKLALAKGYDCIGWTYDPLQSGNANFNIRRLGCVCNIYHVDFYGEVQDGLNLGLPTDRFEVRWWLKHVEPGKSEVDGNRVDIGSYVVTRLPNGLPSDFRPPSDEQETVLVEIPSNINEIRNVSLDVAIAWRQVTRQAFETLFQSGFAVVDFVRIPSPNSDIVHYCYVLDRSAS